MTSTGPLVRITIHDLAALEREWLGGLFAQSGGIADERFTIAALTSAAARGIRAHSAVGITTAGLVVDLPPTRSDA